MTLKLAIFVLIFSSFSTAIEYDYYWKDFNGEIPSDAFAGGTDAVGNPTYIGQTYFEQRNIMVPTIIEKGNRMAYTGTENKKYESDKNTKILCAQNTTTLRWIPTTTTAMRSLISCNFVYGGSWHRVPVTIGRANHLGRTLTGMVFDDFPHKWYGLWIFDRNFKTLKLQEFELLVSDCEPSLTERYNR